MQPRPYPLFRKEVSYFSRALDPYIALLVAAGFAYSEYLASWLTPAKATVPLLLVVVFQLPAIINPYALDSPAELDRYRLMPLPAGRILAQKHMALVTIVLISLLPLIAAMLLRMTVQQSLASLFQLSVIVLSWLCAGVFLMRLEEARYIQRAFGSLSGTGFPVGLFGLAVSIIGIPSIVGAVIARGHGSSFQMMSSVGLLCALCAIYVLALRASKTDWVFPHPSDQKATVSEIGVPSP